jgi:O-antigen ligase
MTVYLIFAATKKIRQLASVIVIILVIIIVSVPNLRWRFALPFYGEKSAVSRLSLWQTGINGIKESPILGLGLTGFSQNWNRLNTDPGLTDTHNFPHNIFLDFWVETGTLGLISFIGLVGLIIYRNLRFSRNIFSRSASKGEESQTKTEILLPINRDQDDAIKLGVVLFLIALTFQGLVDNPYFKNDLAMVFWIILSLF